MIQPWPSHSQRPRWILVPYLLIGDLQNTVLSAILVFSDRLIYPSYGTTPRLFGLSALADQAAAGAIMWVIGSTVFLIPAIVIAVQWLSSRKIVAIAVTGQESQSLDAVFAVGRGCAFAPRMLRAAFAPRPSRRSRFVVLFVVAGLCLAALASRGSDDDDVALRLRKPRDRSSSRCSRCRVISTPGAPSSACWCRTATPCRLCRTPRSNCRRSRRARRNRRREFGRVATTPRISFCRQRRSTCRPRATGL